MLRIAVTALVGVFALTVWSCQSGAPEKYVRPSDGCKCKCNHCTGEPGSKCYCGTGGCECGMKMAKCQCGHCTGVAGGDDGKGNCTCGKK